MFESNGCSPHVAGILARNCASAEQAGNTGHGLFRMAGYVSTLRSGWVDGHAIPRLEPSAAGFLRVDAMNGFAQPALLAARTALLQMVSDNGVAVLAIRNSHHLSALSLDVEPFAQEGLVALSVINSMAAVVPYGGTVPIFGTNPIAFAAPRADGPPIVFDMATSSMAHGEVSIAEREKRSLPPRTGVSRDGVETTDPKSVLDGGALLPFGGHKGSALAMMVEILCAALVGSRFSFEVDWSRHPGAKTPNTGQTIILIDPSAGGGPADFASRVEDLVRQLRQSGQARLPGERSAAARLISKKTGIPVSDTMLAALEDLKPLRQRPHQRGSSC
ncbi:Ldh family oxidoreductase [Agrobacterium tumefaciens]|uniref:Ldh family oxidoreductase n=1 Tax=Agrobacterium tumefaciens TaxID=358 RepID=UPI002FDBE9A4